jgi:ribosomal protein L27
MLETKHDFHSLPWTYLKVKSSGVVHGQLHTEAASVLKKQKPHVEVAGRNTKRLDSRNLRHVPVLLQFMIISLGCIITHFVDYDTCRKCNDSWDNRDSPPRQSGISVKDGFESGKEEGSNNNLRDRGTKISPSSHQSIGSSDDLFCKHSASPVLTHDKGSSRNTNKQADNGKARGRLHKSSTSGRNGSSAKDNCKENASSIFVTQGAQNKSNQNGASNPSNGRIPNFLLCEAKIVTNFGKQWGYSKPNEKGNEKRPPLCREADQRKRSTEKHTLTKGSLVHLIILSISHNFDRKDNLAYHEQWKARICGRLKLQS